jgi:hypothetical protein
MNGRIVMIYKLKVHYANQENFVLCQSRYNKHIMQTLISLVEFSSFVMNQVNNKNAASSVTEAPEYR